MALLEPQTQSCEMASFDRINDSMVSHLTGYLCDYSNELHVLVTMQLSLSLSLAICTLKINVYKSHQRPRKRGNINNKSSNAKHQKSARRI